MCPNKRKKTEKIIEIMRKSMMSEYHGPLYYGRGSSEELIHTINVNIDKFRKNFEKISESP